MIYFKELYHRSFFFALAIIIGVTTIYLYRQEFFFILALPALNQTFVVEHFIFTTPQEVFSFTILTCALFTFFFFSPYLLWTVFDYLRPGMHSREYKQVKMWGFYIFIGFLVFNCVLFLEVCPWFWNFFYTFSIEKKESILKFFFELRAQAYFDFVLNLLLVMNLFFLLLSFFILTGRNYKGHIIAKKKRYFILASILISTLLTPPLLELQIILFTFLYVCIEIFFYFLFLIKTYKGNQLKTINTEETKTR